MNLSQRELGTVLAALRYYQSCCVEGQLGADSDPSAVESIATCDGDCTALTGDEIDELCETLNCKMLDSELLAAVKQAAVVAASHNGGVSEYANDVGKAEYVTAKAVPGTLVVARRDYHINKGPAGSRYDSYLVLADGTAVLVAAHIDRTLRRLANLTEDKDADPKAT